MSGQQHAPAALYFRERPGTHFTGGWMGPRAGLDGRKISSPPGFHPRTVQPVAQSLYRLSYPAHTNTHKHTHIHTHTHTHKLTYIRYYFCMMTNKCTIISHNITLLHVSTLSCHPQGVFNQCLARLHKYFKCSCW